MILKETLRQIVDFQKKELLARDVGITRELRSSIENIPYTVIISGVRRCGKSTLMRQLLNAKSLPYYLSFEDQRLFQFDVSDFERLDEVFKEIHDKSNNYFFDEIQNVEGWERYVRKMQDASAIFVLTGSNASLLSKELGTKLTGRYIVKELYPFSYKEFLVLKNKKASISSFDEYFLKGGFPEYLRFERIDLLQQIFKDILLRDIANRHKIRNVKSLQDIALFLLGNVGKEISYNRLKEAFHLGSTNTVISYLSYFEDSYLIFTVPKFDYSFKRQVVSPKKVYSIDVGLSRANSVSFSEDSGRMLENLVFLQLKREGRRVFYFKEKNECDFIVMEKDKARLPIQVCHILTEENKEREFAGLTEAMNTLKLRKGIILTYNQEDKFKVGTLSITVKPVWKWLLEKQE